MRGLPVAPVVFFLDVDNTLLDNDFVIQDLAQHLDREIGTEGRDRYWAIFEQMRSERGYADYLGALQRYRIAYPHDRHLLLLSSFLIDYPFADRLFPDALGVIAHLGTWGTTVLLTDGDVVFQPRKIMRSGLSDAVSGRVLITLHKERELDDVERSYPAKHYVLVDDKIRILSAVKAAWGERLTTVFVRQGHYAREAAASSYPPADLAVDRIGDLLRVDLPTLLGAGNTRDEP
jgi:hypothetical protein